MSDKQFVAIKTKDGLWLSAQRNGTMQTREEVHGWERFEVDPVSTMSNLRLTTAHGALYVMEVPDITGVEAFPLPFVLPE